MNNGITQLRNEVNDKMVKKFGMKIDFDEMEETVLTRLLLKHAKKCDDARDKEKAIRRLKVILMFNSILIKIIFFFRFPP